MSIVVLVRCNGFCALPSSVGFAMATLRRGFVNLTSSTNALSSWSSFAPPVRNFKDKCLNNNNNNHHHHSSCYASRVKIPGIPLVVTSFVSSESRGISEREAKRPHSYCSKHSRLCFTRSRSYLIKPLGFLLGREGGEVVSKKNFVVTTDSPLDLSPESSLGQVSGDLEQESEDASGDSFPRGTYQSPAALCEAAPATATITEVEIGVMAELEDALGFPLGQEPQSPSPKPLVIVISGPSGVGKDAVIKKLQQARTDIHFVVSATTRAMRPGEVDGVDYYFMSKTEFQEMIENHELLEHAIVYGDYKGIPKQQVREFMSQGMDVVLRVDVQGAATVRSILGSEAVFIFLVAESEVALVKRLIERKTETMDKMLVRVATAREELTRMEEFDYVVVNQEGCLDRTVSLICNIIDAEKARVKPKSAEV